METSKIIALCLVVGMVLMINLLLFAGVRRQSLIRGLFGDIEMFRRAGERARNPWQGEEDHMRELSRLVEEIKKGDRDPDEGSDSP